eukprot:scaffold7132_cov140-Skeletonema_menzelii.AAC.1
MLWVLVQARPKFGGWGLCRSGHNIAGGLTWRRTMLRTLGVVAEEKPAAQWPQPIVRADCPYLEIEDVGDTEC